MKSHDRNDALPFVSVIIPVYNDPSGLDRCLHALEGQSYGATNFEVIVVDNGSDPDLRPRTSFRSLRFRLLEEPRPGSYRARNLGVLHAQGDFFAFTDADCVPGKRWIETGIRCLTEASGAVGAATGPVEIFFQNPSRPTAIELYESLHAFTQESNATELGFGVTANLFVSTSVWKSVGNFDGTLKSGGDKEWGERLTAHGLIVKYCPRARIYHPARETWFAYARRVWRVLEGYDAMRRRTGYTTPQFVMDLMSTWARALRSPKVAWANRRRPGGWLGAFKYVFAALVTAAVSTYARLAIRFGMLQRWRTERAR